jgi:hypothetical protein
MGASAPSDITDLRASSTAAAERTKLAIPHQPPSQEALARFRDAILDLHADGLAFYKVAVLEARRADTAEEVAAIWKEVLGFARAMIGGWKHLQGFDPATQSLIDHYQALLSKLEAVASEHHRVHDPENDRLRRI